MEIQILYELYDANHDWDNFVIDVETICDDLDTKQPGSCVLCTVLSLPLTFRERLKLTKKVMHCANKTCAHEISEFLKELGQHDRLDVVRLMLTNGVYFSPDAIVKILIGLNSDSNSKVIDYLFSNSVGTAQHYVEKYIHTAILNNDHTLMDNITKIFCKLPEIGSYYSTQAFHNGMMFVYPVKFRMADYRVREIVAHCVAQKTYRFVPDICEAYTDSAIAHICRLRDTAALSCAKSHVVHCVKYCVRYHWDAGLLLITQICDLRLYDNIQVNYTVFQRFNPRNAKNKFATSVLQEYWPVSWHWCF